MRNKIRLRVHHHGLRPRKGEKQPKVEKLQDRDRVAAEKKRKR